MSAPVNVFLFGDQSYDFVPSLRELLKTNNNPILSAFLDQAHYVLRAQAIKSLPPSIHKPCRTTSVAQLLRKYVDGVLPASFTTPLFCLAQLGCFMRDYSGGSYPTAGCNFNLGICGGALAASAISCSRSLSELLPVAVQTVLIAFRLGICIAERRDQLEAAVSERSRPWSVAIPLNPQDATTAIEILSTSLALPPPRRPWITTTSKSNTTVSGAPWVLEKLLQLPQVAGLRTKSIPVYIPVHNPALFTLEDVDQILSPLRGSACMATPFIIPFISSASGQLTAAENYGALIEVVLKQILLEPIAWDAVEESVPKLIKARGDDSSVRIVPLNTNAAHALRSALDSYFDSVQIEKPGASGKSENSHRPDDQKKKIAIVSMSGRFPESPSTESFWDLLYKGLDVCKKVPMRRWNVDTHVDPSGKTRNKGATPWGCWLDFYDQFDPKFFSISPKEAPQMDPAQRMALMSTWEAMERGGIVPDTTPSTQRNRVGVFHGVTSNDWMEVNTAQNVDTYFITGGNRGFIPGRINFCFEFSGPSYANDTACSSSLAAIHLACNSLWRGDCDTAIAGGTNMIFMPDGHTGLDKGFFLSRTGNCKTFDDQADGYCRAEGVGTLFLKRLEDAIADGDPILGTILATQTNHSSMSESITRPLAQAQIDNMRAVLDMALVDANSVSYVEMHGTGTQVGDAEEMKSVLTCFAPDEKTRKNDPLFIGSAKANVGHGEGVSGVTSVIKVLLMMQHNTIPPHCGIKPGSKINRNFPDLKARNVNIAFEPTSWVRKDSIKPRRAIINNFSAAGGNSALLLEDAPIISPVSEVVDPRKSHIVTVSAHTGKSMVGNLENLLSHLEKEEYSLPQLSYTTTARRWHHAHRVALTGTSISEIRSSIRRALENGNGVNRPKGKSNVVFAFTGQGSQFLGMGKELYHSVPSFKDDLERLDRLAQKHGFQSFTHIYTAENPAQKIENMSPVQAQLAITSLQIALGKLLISWGAQPSAVFGHSLGEYAALHFAGVLSASDAIYLVGMRAQLLERTCQPFTHAMLAVRSGTAALEQILRDHGGEVACVNGPSDTVMSGKHEDMLAAQKTLSAAGAKSTLLPLPYAFHSAQVEPFLEDFKSASRGVSFQSPSIPLLSLLTGEVMQAEDCITPDYLAEHCRKTVNLVAALESARQQSLIRDNTIMIEIGPKPILCAMVKATLGHSSVFPTLDAKGNAWSNLQAVLSSLYTAGVNVNWVAYQAPFKSAHKVISLPSYAWDLKSYDIPYEGEWILHRHKIHCDCADGDNQWETAKYVPGQHTFAKNIVVPDEASVAVNGKVKKGSKLNPDVEAYPSIGLTTAVHKLLSEKTEPLGATLVVETDLSRKDINGIARGHVVDSIPLVTPSVYADIAMQVGKYAMDRIRAGHPGAIDGIVEISNMVVDKALVPHGLEPQLLRTTLSLTWPPKAAATTRSGQVKFETYYSDGKLDTVHGSCTVRFSTESQLKSLRKKVPEYRAAIQRLKARSSDLTKYSGKRGYKLMSSLAGFHPDYKLLDSVILDEDANEATCIVRCDGCKDQGNYVAHPAHVDALMQLSSFSMNANDDTNLDEHVFTNHGWGSLQIYKKLQKGVSYEIYTKLTQAGDSAHGDIIVLDGDEVVAFFGNLSVSLFYRRQARSLSSTRRTDKITATAVSKPQVVAKHTNRASSPSSSDSEAPSFHDSAIGTPTEEKPAYAFEKARKIIAEESGIAEDDLTDDTEFADAGVDSLCSLVIGSRLREELDMDLDPDFSLFGAFTTVGELRSLFKGNVSDAPDDSEARSLVATPIEISNTPVEPTPMEISDNLVELVPFCRPTKSVVLQGTPKTARTTLFLLPDGSGSATSYTGIPRVSSDIALVGLICPYSRDAENMNCTHGSMMESFVNEIRRRQPHGPYHVGGWSSGGAFAFMVAELLINQGEEVHSIVVIDAPVPQPMEKLPYEFYDYCNSLGLFPEQPGESADAGPPDYLIPHFIAVVDVCMDYRSSPLKTRRMPKLGLIWASDTVMDEATAPKMEGMHFMVNKRTDFGPDGWDQVLPGGEVDIIVAEGANHFTLMRPPYVDLVREIINRVVGEQE
ncbi:polyketide synthase-like protein [Lojkania enalia]|uniref:Polyketide synthase-like protein n=1 Tax=Lojkania enalia TaxID=147567 RepID=A0A9P4MZ06_9PLEO|nr:polyketide synthase-like protein [Didymosphaeria enalia]